MASIQDDEHYFQDLRMVSFVEKFYFNGGATTAIFVISGMNEIKMADTCLKLSFQVKLLQISFYNGRVICRLFCHF